MTKTARDDEPTAAAPREERQRFLVLAALFLAGPAIWATHFMSVYLLGEVLCLAAADRQLLGLPLLSTLTLIATVAAVAMAAVTTWWAYGRWKASGVAWTVSRPENVSEGGEQEGHLALAGWLMGALFIVAILFVGLPAAVLAC